jgi:hypothetical protein
MSEYVIALGIPIGDHLGGVSHVNQTPKFANNYIPKDI